MRPQMRLGNKGEVREAAVFLQACQAACPRWMSKPATNQNCTTRPAHRIALPTRVIVELQ